ncbi:MAG TPA: D-arabinono-1,4-lactone oxidase [Pseudomonadales bacterium]
MISRRRLLAGAALAGVFGAAGPVRSAAAPPLPWRNWSGALLAHPAGRIAPASEEALAEWLRRTDGPIRPVGAGHSFAPLVPTDGHLLVLDRLSGLLDYDAERLQATFGAGTRLSDLGPALEGVGQGPLILPDIDRQTLAGAISTGTHGTGRTLHSLSGNVRALRMVTADGKALDVTPEQGDLFRAACVSLGALGVITRVRLQNRAAYRLHRRDWVQRTEEVLESFETSAARHRHFEMFPLTHSDYALVLAIDETDAPIDHTPPSPEEEAAFAQTMASWLEVPPGERRPLINAVAEQIEPTEAVDVSYRILSNVRSNRFNEMEYAVPREAGADCLREVLDTIARNEIDVVFPLEYRYVRGDDLWLSMDADGDRAAISVHQHAGGDYRPLFQAVEPIFWKYGGRPHWGKLHTLGYAELRRLYPHYDDFCALRAELDPRGRLLNDHLRKLFQA